MFLFKAKSCNHLTLSIKNVNKTWWIKTDKRIGPKSEGERIVCQCEISNFSTGGPHQHTWEMVHRGLEEIQAGITEKNNDTFIRLDFSLSVFLEVVLRIFYNWVWFKVWEGAILLNMLHDNQLLLCNWRFEHCVLLLFTYKNGLSFAHS